MSLNKRLSEIFVQATQIALLGGDPAEGHRLMDEYDKSSGHNSRPAPEPEDKDKSKSEPKPPAQP